MNKARYKFLGLNLDYSIDKARKSSATPPRSRPSRGSPPRWPTSRSGPLPDSLRPARDVPEGHREDPGAERPAVPLGLARSVPDGPRLAVAAKAQVRTLATSRKGGLM